VLFRLVYLLMARLFGCVVLPARSDALGGRRREFPDHTLVWNQAHLRQLLRQYQTHHNQHRPHRSLHGGAPLKPPPKPADLDLYLVRNRLRSVA
jgi:hypothetical protein